jgi:phage terminase small subunit
MARGGYRPGAGRPPGSGKGQDEDVTGSIHDEEAAEPCASDPDGIERTPLEYMLKVMNDTTADASRRDRMAIAAAPFVHGKIPEGGKKDARNDAAKDASGGKFKPAAAPSLKLVQK